MPQEPSVKQNDAMHQLKKEMLLIVFGLQRFDQFVCGKEIEVESDHKTLEVILKKKATQLSECRVYY